MIFLADTEGVSLHWPRVAPMLERAVIRQTELGLQDIFTLLMNQRMHLWIRPWSGALVVQLQQFPQERRCVMVLGGGSDIDATLKDKATLEAWARSQGCTRMRLEGRKGWVRKLPDYEAIATVLEKTL